MGMQYFTLLVIMSEMHESEAKWPIVLNEYFASSFSAWLTCSCDTISQKIYCFSHSMCKPLIARNFK